MTLNYGCNKDDNSTAPQQSTQGTITINSTPSGAIVYLDNNNTSKVTPANIQSSVGTHQIKLVLVGYQDWKQEVIVMAGQAIPLSAILQEASIFEEDFEGDAVNRWVLGTGWSISTDTVYEGGKALKLRLYEKYSEYTEAATIAGSFNLSNIPSAVLRFWVRQGYRETRYLGNLRLEISIDNGSSWTYIKTVGNYKYIWLQYEVDLSKWIGPGSGSVKIRFRGYDEFYHWSRPHDFKFWIDYISIRKQ